MTFFPRYPNLKIEVDPYNLLKLGKFEIATMLDSWLQLKLFQLNLLQPTTIVKQAIQLLENEQDARERHTMMMLNLAKVNKKNKVPRPKATKGFTLQHEQGYKLNNRLKNERFTVDDF